MDVILHVGAHKTASTHLQRMLRGARAALDEAGVAMFTPNELRLPEGLPLEPALAGDAGAAEALRAAMAGAGSRLVVSEENLLGPSMRPEAPGVLYPHAERRLAAFLEATGLGSVRLMLAVREPVDWLISSHAQRMMAGRWIGFDAFVDGFDPRSLAWSGYVERLMAVPGVTGCDVWRVEDWPGVLPAVLGRMLPEGLVPAVRLLPGVTHAGLSARALALMAEARPAPTDREARRAVALAARGRFPKGPENPAPAPFAPALVAESAAAHAADLARLAALPGVTLLHPAAGLRG
jgi:hypothetical protein